MLACDRMVLAVTPLSVVVPLPVKFIVAPAERVRVPETVRLRPLATFQVWAPVPIATPLEIETFWLADDMSMPPVPSVSVFVPIETAPAGLVTRSPRIDVLVVSVVDRFDVEVESKSAASLAVGAVPPAQFVVVPQAALVEPSHVLVAAAAGAAANGAATMVAANASAWTERQTRQRARMVMASCK